MIMNMILFTVYVVFGANQSLGAGNFMRVLISYFICMNDCHVEDISYFCVIIREKNLRTFILIVKFDEHWLLLGYTLVIALMMIMR